MIQSPLRAPPHDVRRRRAPAFCASRLPLEFWRGVRLCSHIANIVPQINLVCDPVVPAASEELVRSPLTLAERRAPLLADRNRYPRVLHVERECFVYANTQLRCIVSPCANFKCRSAAGSLIRFHIFGDSDDGLDASFCVTSIPVEVQSNLYYPIPL